ncbi:MAG: phosphate ABC transporter ATP-binding protein [Phycisphaerae bacterium]|nr:phosphate ABC transporter ATP-binding protein [Phycisphaerae bacterium]
MEKTAPCCTPRTYLEVTDLTVKYKNTTALRHVSIEIPRGCVTAIVGPSGCGKSTLLHVINRMTDAVAGCDVRGSVRLAGAEVLGKGVDLRMLRRRVGLIFQRPNPLPLSIAENVLLPLRDHGFTGREERASILERVLHEVGLWDEVAQRLNAPAATLSGGQQQRLCIARCLALLPEVILFDEPCSALDPIAAEIIEQLICRLRNRYTVVIVTHNLAQARRVADFTAVLWNREGASSLVEFGKTRHIFERPTQGLTSLYVGGVTG